MKKTQKIEHKTPQDEFFYNMQVRKTLIYNATREFVYGRELYRAPVTDLTDFGMETRFAYYQLLQLNLAKLFCDGRNENYNIHRLLKQFRESPDFDGLLTADQHLDLTDRLAIFGPTIEGLRFVRDKWVAHTDVLGGIAPLDSFFPAIESLLHFGYELLDVCSQAVLQTQVHNPLPTMGVRNLSIYKART